MAITDGSLNPTALSSWKYCNCSSEVYTSPDEFFDAVPAGAARVWVNVWNVKKDYRVEENKKNEIADDYEAYS